LQIVILVAQRLGVVVAVAVFGVGVGIELHNGCRFKTVISLEGKVLNVC